jgi:hypothetical protein
MLMYWWRVPFTRLMQQHRDCCGSAAPAGVLLFVQLLPVAVACFEYQRFMDHVGCAVHKCSTSSAVHKAVHAAVQMASWIMWVEQYTSAVQVVQCTRQKIMNQARPAVHMPPEHAPRVFDVQI